MSFAVKQNTDGTTEIVAAPDSAAKSVKVTFATNVDAEIGRGATDADRTYIALRRSDGTKVYIYVDTGTTVLCSATKP